MEKEEVRGILNREPFVPLRIRLKTGRKFDVPFRDVAQFLGYGVLVFIGLKEGTHSAKSYDRFGFDQIESIEPLKKGNGGRRKKAS